MPTYHSVVANGMAEQADVVLRLRGTEDGQTQARGSLDHAVGAG